jgi:hypothetical protein
MIILYYCILIYFVEQNRWQAMIFRIRGHPSPRGKRVRITCNDTKNAHHASPRYGHASDFQGWAN